MILPSATYRAPDFLAAARALGVEVVAASDRRAAMSEAMGARALTLPLRRADDAVEAIVAHAERTPLDAVVAVDDQGAVVAARAAARLGLRANPPEAVARTRDKRAMRATLAADGVRQPRFRTVGLDDDPGTRGAEVGFPCVVKPAGLAASRGVIRADDTDGARRAAARARTIQAEAGHDLDEPLLVESFLPGPELAVEALLRAGELMTLAIFDKPDPLDGPYFEETLYVTPARLSVATRADVERTVAAAATALGVVEGPVHAEVRLGGDGPAVIELAARSIGGLCARTLRFGASISLEELILRHALDLPLGDLQRAPGAAGVVMLPIPRAGTLRAVAGQDRARAVPGIVGLEISIAPGRPVRPLPAGDRYLGFLFARADEPAAVERALRAAHAELDVAIEEPLPVAAAG